MVSVIKFSQFNQMDLTEPNNKLVGLSNGTNAIVNSILSWTTLTRPTPPQGGLIGFNTDIDQYEFYSSILARWVQLLTSTTPIEWSDVTAVSIAASVNNGYITDRTVTPVNILLPTTFSIGDEISIMGKGTGGWSLVANSGQIIVMGSLSTSTAGAINSEIQYGNITVKGLIPNTTWEVTSVFGNPTIL